MPGGRAVTLRRGLPGRAARGVKCSRDDEGLTLRLDADAAGVTAGSAPPPFASQTALAWLDLVRGARAAHLWSLLGWQDVRRRYRRSRLGPFWVTISMGVLVAALGTLYGALLRAELAEYVPFLALGFIVWTLISGLITEGCDAFVGADAIIKHVGLPLSIHVYRVVWRNLLIFCHNVTIFAVVVLVFPVRPGWAGLLAVPGLVLLCASGLAVGLMLGLVAARFRDVPPIVESVLRIAFFVTPIIWMPALLPRRAELILFNPLFHFLEVVRGPLLGQPPGLVSWVVVLGVAAGSWLAAFALFRRYRRRIAYWV